ncbi:MAG: glycosyltransferase [Verrucomicrobiota bacterium]
MHVAYVDPSLRDNVGHHRSLAEFILPELRRKCERVEVFANRWCEPPILAELGAHGFFAHAAYETFDSTSEAERRAYRRQSLRFALEFLKLASSGPFDLLYLATAFGAELAGLRIALPALITQRRLPMIVAEIGLPLSPPYTQDLGDQLREEAARYQKARLPLRLVAFDAAIGHTANLGIEVDRAPAVHVRAKPAVPPGGDGVVFGFLGHQRPEKGWLLLRPIIEATLSRSPRARFFVHNVAGQEDETSRALRALAKQDARVEYLEASFGQRDFARLYNRLDVVVLPYERARYAESYSAIAIEAVAAAVPLVATGETTMSALAAKWQWSQFEGEPAAGLENLEPETQTVADVLTQIAENPGPYRAAAQRGAERYRRENGADRFADFLQELHAQNAARLAPSTGWLTACSYLPQPWRRPLARLHVSLLRKRHR